MTNKEFLEIKKKVRNDYVNAQRETIKAFIHTNSNGKHVAIVWGMFNDIFKDSDKQIEYYSSLKPNTICKYDYVEENSYSDLPY